MLGQWLTAEFKKGLSAAEQEFCINASKRNRTFSISLATNLESSFVSNLYRKRPVIGVIVDKYNFYREKSGLLFSSFKFDVSYVDIKDQDLIDLVSIKPSSFNISQYLDIYQAEHSTLPQKISIIVYDAESFVKQIQKDGTISTIRDRYPLFYDWIPSSLTITLGDDKLYSLIALEILTYLSPAKYQELQEKAELCQESVIKTLNISYQEIPDFVKAWVVFSFIQQHVFYHSALSRKFDPEKSIHPTEAESLTAYGALCNKKAISRGIADAYEWLMDKVGIPCVKICGILEDEDAETPYYYNSIWLGNEGKVYFVDCSYGVENKDAVDPTAFLNISIFVEKYKYYVNLIDKDHVDYSYDISFYDVWEYVNKYKENLTAYGIPERFLLPNII